MQITSAINNVPFDHSGLNSMAHYDNISFNGRIQTILDASRYW